MNQTKKKNPLKRLLSMRGMGQVVTVTIGLIVLLVAFALINPNFWSPTNRTNLLRQIAPILIIGIAQSYVLITGNIDLSIGSVVGMSTMVAATLMSKGIMSPIPALLVTLLCCLLMLASAVLLVLAAGVFTAPTTHLSLFSALVLIFMLIVGNRVLTNNAEATLLDVVHDNIDDVEYEGGYLDLDELNLYRHNVYILVYDEQEQLIGGAGLRHFDGDEEFMNGQTRDVTIDGEKYLVYDLYVQNPGGNVWLRGITSTDNSFSAVRVIVILSLVLFPVLVLLTAVVLFATGIAGSSVAALKDLTDTARIALLPGSGWPQQTGVAELEQIAPLTGSFVELGDEGCVVWSRTGKKLNSIQSGYARPALAAGKTRFVLYNRSGNELRVESRTQNLYTKQLENSIFLCAMSDNGTLAVVTEDQTSMAKLLVYSPSMEQQLSWSMTSNDGTPLRMAFSPDSRKLAAAAVTVSGGQVMTNLYLINLASGDPVSLVNQGGVPQWLGWTSASTILAVYDTRAVLYNAGGGERAVYDFAGTELKDVSVDAAGNVALLLASGQVSQAVTLDKNLNVQFSAAVSAANSIVRAGNLFYLLADNAVECFDASGAQQWSQNLDTSPQALLANSRDLLLFSGNTVQKLAAPAE